MKTRAERIADVVTMMGEAWRQKITPATMLTFATGTEDIRIEDVERGAMRAIRECQFMPSVFELRQLCGASIGKLSAKDRPTLAWCDVRRAISRVGGYDSPDFEDPVINATIREMGGWVLLCNSTVEELVWREKDFLRMYSALATCHLDDERTERLAGICERENGTAIPAPVVEVSCLTTNGTARVRRVNVIETKRLASPSQAAVALSQRLEFDDREKPDSVPVTVLSREQQILALRAMNARSA